MEDFEFGENLGGVRRPGCKETHDWLKAFLEEIDMIDSALTLQGMNRKEIEKVMLHNILSVKRDCPPVYGKKDSDSSLSGIPRKVFLLHQRLKGLRAKRVLTTPA